MWFRIGRRRARARSRTREREIERSWRRKRYGAPGWIRHPPTLTPGLRDLSVPPTPSFHPCLPSLPSFFILLEAKNGGSPLNETDWLHRPDKRSVESHREIQLPRFSCFRIRRVFVGCIDETRGELSLECVHASSSSVRFSSVEETRFHTSGGSSKSKIGETNVSWIYRSLSFRLTTSRAGNWFALFSFFLNLFNFLCIFVHRVKTKNMNFRHLSTMARLRIESYSVANARTRWIETKSSAFACQCESRRIRFTGWGIWGRLNEWTEKMHRAIARYNLISIFSFFVDFRIWSNVILNYFHHETRKRKRLSVLNFAVTLLVTSSQDTSQDLDFKEKVNYTKKSKLNIDK